MVARRIVFFSPGWPPAAVPNGIVTYIANLRGALSEFGFASHIVAHDMPASERPADVTEMRTPRGARPLLRRLMDRALWTLLPELSGLWRSERELLRLLRSNRLPPFDLVEIDEAFGFAESVRRHVRQPAIVRLHGPWFLNGPALGVPDDPAFRCRVQREGLAISRAAAVSAPSRDVLDRVRRRYGLPLPDAEVIPNPGPVIPAMQRWSAAACKRDLLLFVGRFDRHKGGDLVIDAFREVAREIPSLELCYIGPDRGFTDAHGRTFDLPTFIQERLPESDLRRRVMVLGAQPHEAIAELRRCAAVTLVASRYENFPMTVLEAVAHGSPIVASDAGGIPEIVQDERTGLTFRAGDHHGLACKIRRLLSDPPLAAALGAHARADFEARFSPKVVAQATAAFYERVLERARTGARRTGSLVGSGTL